jgi:hypothetical protein
LGFGDFAVETTCLSSVFILFNLSLVLLVDSKCQGLEENNNASGKDHNKDEIDAEAALSNWLFPPSWRIEFVPSTY